MADTSGRMLRLLSLLQSPVPWTGPSLARELDVSVRTVRRDIDTLRGLGYTVEVSRGVGGHYSLRSGQRLPPLVFDDQQALAVAVALQAAPRSVVGLDQSAARALATLLQVLPSRLRHQAAGLRITSVENLWDLAPAPVPAATLVAVAAAIDRRETVRYDLAGAGSDTYSGEAATLQPHHLVCWAARWCVLGWSPAENDWRTVQLDRMRLRTPHGPRFTARPIPGDDVEAFFVAQLDRGDDPGRWPCAGSATVEQPADLVARYAPGGTSVRPLGPTRCRATLGAWSWNGIAALLASFDASVTDAEPAELRSACRELGCRLS